MDIDEAKLFVGGISRETREETLRNHFSKYGAVLGSQIAKDRITGNPRGFGFVWFSDPSFAVRALQDTHHVILGRTVEVKRAIPKTEQHPDHFHQQQHDHHHHHANQDANKGSGMDSSDGTAQEYHRTKKVFVGGLASSLTEEQFKDYFEKFGRIIDVVVMQDSLTNRPRGFGFVTFDSEESVDKVMLKNFHVLNGRTVEVKRAVPKDRINANFSRCSLNGTFNMSLQLGNYPFYGPGCEIPPYYYPFPLYNGAQGYLYGLGMYGGGYPMTGYGRPGFGVLPIAAPRSPWSGPFVLGAGPFPYSNACLSPAYMNSVSSHMGVMAGGHNGIIEPGMNGKFDWVIGGNERDRSDATAHEEGKDGC